MSMDEERESLYLVLSFCVGGRAERELWGDCPQATALSPLAYSCAGGRGRAEGERGV